MSYFVIGDSAGQFKTLMELVKQLPSDANIILLGDEMDRGPDSNKIVEWALENQQKVQTILSNHSHMMLDYLTNKSEHYGDHCWLGNGGNATLRAYNNIVPQAHLNFLASRPSKIELEIGENKYWISHAFPTAHWLNHADEPEPPLFSALMEDRLWNRNYPIMHARYSMAICGHNSHFGLRSWSVGNVSGKTYGQCIDTSRNSILTALHLPSMKTYEQKYI